jgi:hypothetical protein
MVHKLASPIEINIVGQAYAAYAGYHKAWPYPESLYGQLFTYWMIMRSLGIESLRVCVWISPDQETEKFDAVCGELLSTC